MNEPSNAIKEEIVRKIWGSTYGERTPNEQEIREIMDAEMHKPLKDIDNTLVDKCSQLLCSLYECEEAANVSEAAIAESKRNFRARIADKEQCMNWPALLGRKYILRTIVATIICIVAIGVTGLLIEPGTLKTQTSDDGEDYMTYGQTPVFDPITNGTADRVLSNDSYSTNNLMDAFAFLGYEICMPTDLPENLSLSEVNIITDEVFDTVQCIYCVNAERVLQLDIDVIHDYSGVTIAREQNQNGETIVLPSKKTVYAAQNIEKNWVVYSLENTVYQITSNHYDLETLLSIIDSIEEE